MLVRFQSCGCGGTREGQAWPSVPETFCAVASHPSSLLRARLIQFLLKRFSIPVDHLRSFCIRFCLNHGWLDRAFGCLLPALVQLLLCYSERALQLGNAVLERNSA